MTKISVIGLGKLGSCMAACFAAKGHDVVGVDINPDFVDAVNAGKAPVTEPRLEETIQEAGDNLRATADYSEAIPESDASFIIVPTPSEEDGAFSVDYVLEAGRSIGEQLREVDDYHLVVLTSTVLPGSTEHALQRVLEETSGKTCGEDFGLCYSPEFIAIGSVIDDFLEPDFLLIGESDERAGDMLERIYETTVENGAPAARMNFANAELTKIALNTYVTTKITFANLMAETCENIPGADVDVVTSALGLDGRIGENYLGGGLGYGGPCFPRDNVALSRFLEVLDVDPSLPRTVDSVNRCQADRVADKAREAISSQEGTIAVLGLSYKPGTPLAVESQGVFIAEALANAGEDVIVYDPLAMEQASKRLGDAVTYADSLEASLEGAAVAVIATPWPEFERLPELAGDNGEPPVVIDGWRQLREDGQGPTPGYKGIGLGPTQDDAEDSIPAFIRELAGLEEPAEPGVEAPSPTVKS